MHHRFTYLSMVDHHIYVVGLRKAKYHVLFLVYTDHRSVVIFISSCP
jgi:hypothetical protein